MRVLICVCLMSGILHAEPTCPLCERHREYNKEHPGEYEFYEDYLEAEKKKETQIKSEETR